MHQSRVTRQVGSEKDQLTYQGELKNLANRCELPYRDVEQFKRRKKPKQQTSQTSGSYTSL